MKKLLTTETQRTQRGLLLLVQNNSNKQAFLCASAVT